MRVNTDKLLEYLKINRYSWFSVTLIINAFLGSTHTLSYRKSYLYDEDLFDKTIKWEINEFIEAYQDATWIIE